MSVKLNLSWFRTQEPKKEEKLSPVYTQTNVISVHKDQIMLWESESMK